MTTLIVVKAVDLRNYILDYLTYSDFTIFLMLHTNDDPFRGPPRRVGFHAVEGLLESFMASKFSKIYPYPAIGQKFHVFMV